MKIRGAVKILENDFYLDRKKTKNQVSILLNENDKTEILHNK